MKIVRFHPDADEELLEATAWYVARSASAALRFVEDVDHEIEIIAVAHHARRSGYWRKR